MKRLLALLCLVVLLVAGCTSAERISFPKIDRQPIADWHHMGSLDSIPTYDPKNVENPWQVDLRGRDLSALDLRGQEGNLRYADLDTQTVWPPADRMPATFDPQRVLELNKDPGLGVRGLHLRGITGKGVGIAILDQPLLVNHQEYADRLRLYEEIGIDPMMRAQMHGPAVASIAVGKTVGVAPEADLYYIAEWNGISGDDGSFTWDFTNLAQSIRRILEINRQLPKDRKIRVISISVGWSPDQAGYDEVTAAVEEAKAEGLLVVCSSIEAIHGFKFHGLGRDPLSDPDRFESYQPGSWWADGFYAGRWDGGRLLVPMDSRTTASPAGPTDYAFYWQGGWSWSIPYIAGAYALAVQVDPNMTPDRFWSLALQTGRTIQLQHEGQSYSLGPILDPVALIDALQQGR